MSRDGRRSYCTLDHANKQKELAERSPYEFWLQQLRRDSEGRADERAAEARGRRRGKGMRTACRAGGACRGT